MTDEPITLEQAKLNCRVEVDDETDDDFIDGLIFAARAYIEDRTGLVLTQREITEVRSASCYVDLTAWPIAQITGVTYEDAIGAPQPVDLSTISVSYGRRPVRLRGLVGRSDVEITATAGFAPADVPPAVKQAMLMIVAHWYDNRMAVEAGDRAAAVQLPLAVDALLQRWITVLI